MHNIQMCNSTTVTSVVLAEGGRRGKSSNSYCLLKITLTGHAGCTKIPSTFTELTINTG